MILNEIKEHSTEELRIIAAGFTQVEQIYSREQRIIIKFEAEANIQDKINQLSKSVNNNQYVMIDFIFDYIETAHIDISGILCVIRISCKSSNVFCHGEGEILFIDSNIGVLHGEKIDINIRGSRVEKIVGGHTVYIRFPLPGKTEVNYVTLLKYTSYEYNEIDINTCFTSEIVGAKIHIRGVCRHLTATTNDIVVDTTCRLKVKLSIFCNEFSKNYKLNSLTEMSTIVNNYSDDWGGFSNLYYNVPSHAVIAIMAGDDFDNDYHKHKNIIVSHLGLFNPHKIKQLIAIEPKFEIISKVINHFVNNQKLISTEMLIDLLNDVVNRITTYSDVNYADFASWVDIIFQTGGYMEERDKLTEILLSTGLWNKLSYTTKRHGVKFLMSCLVSNAVKLLPTVEKPLVNNHCYNNNLLFKISLFENSNLNKNQVRQLKSKYNDDSSKILIEKLYTHMNLNKSPVLNHEIMTLYDEAPIVEWECFDKPLDNKILTNHIINIKNLTQYVERTTMSSQTYAGNDQYTMFAVCCTPLVQNNYTMRQYYYLTAKHPRALVPYTMGWVRYTMNRGVVIVSEIQTDFPKFLTVEKILVDSDPVYDVLINNIFKLFLSYIYDNTDANVIVIPTSDTRLMYLGGCVMESVYDRLPKRYGMKISYNEYIEGAYNVRQIQKNR